MPCTNTSMITTGGYRRWVLSFHFCISHFQSVQMIDENSRKVISRSQRETAFVHGDCILVSRSYVHFVMNMFSGIKYQES